MRATDLLEAQHREVEAILDQLDAGKSDASGLLTELANAMAAHMAIEQNLFYPAVREADEELVDTSFEEHAIAEIALKRLLRTPPNDEAFHVRVATLRDVFEHHADEEEEGLFPEVVKALGDEKLEGLGRQMETAFAEAKKEGFEALVPKTFAQTSADEAREIMLAQRHGDPRAVTTDGRTSAV